MFSEITNYPTEDELPMKKWIVIVLACITAMTFLAVFVPRSSAAKRSRDAGMVAFKEKRFEDALTSFDTYLADNETDIVVWVQRGNALLWLERYPEAETSYLTALKLDNRNVKALNAMGVLFRRQDKLDKAVEYYQKALYVQSDYVPTHLCLATIEMERDNNEKALKHARRAYDLERDNPTAAAYLAVAFHVNGMLEERDKLTERAKELGYPEMDNLARIYKEKKPTAKP
jgi:tetratricopeptide (TPR) repeat protein